MSVPPVSSNVHGQLDAQIAQLTQCKPLPEHEVCVLCGMCRDDVRMVVFDFSALWREVSRFFRGISFAKGGVYN